MLGDARGGTHAAVLGALQVAAVAVLVGLVGGGDVEGEPPQERVGHVVGYRGKQAEALTGHVGFLLSVVFAVRRDEWQTANTIDAHLQLKVKSFVCSWL
ncbi:hypothetical protein [Micromonospora sp. NPDC049107]|uniref:hypothetical protein n=1 Tax=Micromonospora sp. NPDC049107 TaxID=3154349 RepID=UPI0033FCC58A